MEAAEDATNEIVAIGISEVSTDVIDAAEAVARSHPGKLESLSKKKPTEIKEIISLALYELYSLKSKLL